MHPLKEVSSNRLCFRQSNSASSYIGFPNHFGQFFFPHLCGVLYGVLYRPVLSVVAGCTRRFHFAMVIRGIPYNRTLALIRPRVRQYVLAPMNGATFQYVRLREEGSRVRGSSVRFFSSRVLRRIHRLYVVTSCSNGPIYVVFRSLYNDNGNVHVLISSSRSSNYRVSTCFR